MNRWLLCAGLALALNGCAGCDPDPVNPDAGPVAEVSASQSTVEVAPASLVADGTTASTLTVTARDAEGNVLEGRAVWLTVSGSGNTLSSVPQDTDADGVATFTLTSTRAEVKTVTAAVADVELEAKPAVTFLPASAARLAIRVQPTDVQAGSAISPSVVIDVQDENGNQIAEGAPVITAALGVKPDGATLTGETTLAAGEGEASFTNLRIDAAGAGYTLVFSSPGLASVETATFDVLTGPPARLAFVAQPANGTSGVALSPAIEIELQDAQGNRVETGAAVTLAIATGPAGANLAGTLTDDATDGLASFADLALDLAGTYTLAATASGFQGATSESFTIAAGAASQLAFVIQPQAVDVRDAFTVSVGVRDAAGNSVAGATPAISLALSATGTGALLGTTTVTAAAGVASFPGLSVTDEGTYTLVASTAGLSDGTSAQFTVTDNVAPAAPTLSVTGSTQTTMTLAWTAVGDDGLLGTAAGQELRYATSALTEAIFATGTPVTVGAPQVPGSAETATASGLTAGTTYHFALRVTDGAGNSGFATASGATATCPVGYTGAACNQCAVGYQETAPGVCEDYCTNPDPCNPAPADTCNGDVAVTYPATLSCTPTTTSPFYTCQAPAQTNCATAGNLCYGGACVANPCSTTTCTPPAASCNGSSEVLTWSSACTVDQGGTSPAAVCTDTSTATTCASGTACHSGACALVALPTPGSLRISEVMYEPSNTALQWFEISNVTESILSLNGVTPVLLSNVTTGVEAAFTVFGSGPVLIYPGEQFVFGANGDPGQNGGVTVDYAYGAQSSGFNLNTHRKMQLMRSSTVLDEVDLATVAPGAPQNGAVNVSAAVLSAELVHQPWYWCPSTATYGAGFLGTPGAANNDCGVVVSPPVDFCKVQFPANAGTVEGAANVPVFARVYEPNVTDRNQAGNDLYPHLVAELGYGRVPATGQPDPAAWTWAPAAFNAGYGASSPGFAPNDDELQANLVISGSGDYLYGFRMRLRDPATGALGPAVYCDTAGVASVPAAGVYGTITVVDPAADLAAARATADGSGLALEVRGAYVTAVKPFFSAGNDPAGFFVQGGAAGPALFVRVDASTLTPAPAVGDRVSFTISELGTTGGLRQAQAVTGFGVDSSGHPLAPFTQEVSNATDLITNLGGYESELLTMTGTIATAFASASAPFVSAQFQTAALGPDTNFRLRVWQDVRDALELVQGCDVTVAGVPMWRFNAQAQPLVWSASNVTVNSCPAPTVASAAATGATTVVVNFDRLLEASSVLATGSQFSITPALTVLGATVTGPRQVTLTTDAQTGGLSYTVTVANTVTDQHGAGVNPLDNQATFTGFSPGCVTPSIIISQVYGGGSNSGAPFTHDFIELHNRGNAPVTINGWSVQYTSSAGTSWSNKIDLAGSIPPGGFYLVQAAGGTVGAPLPTPDATGSISMSATAGKVALVATTTFLTGGCPAATEWIDFVGFGSANCFSGAGPTPAPSNTNAVIRANNGCQDDNNNATNFTAGAPTPRNSGGAVSVCACL